MARLLDRMREYALTFPEAVEDFPWEGHPVAKVRGKIFVFFGDTYEDLPPRMTVKLPESRDAALGIAGAAPSGYGLGKHGWVVVPLNRAAPPVGVLRDWIEESYRTVAPKRLASTLDERAR